MPTRSVAAIPAIQGTSLAVLRLKQVKTRTGRSKSSIYADIKAGRFPAPISLGARASGWLVHEIDAWLTARIAESRGGAL